MPYFYDPPLALSTGVLSSNFIIPANTTSIISHLFKISNGATLKISNTAIFQVT